MEKLLLITPPFTQPNCPYPATAYLKGYLRRKGFEAEQADLSIELINAIFTGDFLKKVFDSYTDTRDENMRRIFALRRNYISVTDTVMSFLKNGDPTLANLICGAGFLPQAGRFETIGDLDHLFGTLGNADCAKYLSTLFLQDLSDFIRTFVSPHFEIVRYGEKLSLSVDSFSKFEKELAKPQNIIEEKMTELLEGMIGEHTPTVVAFSAAFPGNVLSVLRCAQYIKEKHAGIKTVMGGGYPSTELRSMTDKGIFRYLDYIVLDDGELPLERIMSGGRLVNTYTTDGYTAGEERISHAERGCPDFSGLPHGKYISLAESANPMHRLWSDGRWNKMMAAHGCYWAKCSFCDTSLDYIKRFDQVAAPTFADWMEEVMRQTGSSGFHFVDEAAPPKFLRELSLEILRRGLKVSWWTNIRFESTYTGDLCMLMAEAGCIAVSGGLETASDRLLELMNKGIDIEQATVAMRNFYNAGIMVHTYLMYGFPSQTLQETVDSLEVVRQLFRAGLISSAFWHRYAMTVHSPGGEKPEELGVASGKKEPDQFANNEIQFRENRGYSLDAAGAALNEALANYMYGQSIDRPAHKWFHIKNSPEATIENSLVTDHLIKPDSSRIYSGTARLVWTGTEPVALPDGGLLFYGNSGSKSINFTDPQRDFLLRVFELCGDLTRSVSMEEIKHIYEEYSEEPFVVFYHSKKWDRMRTYGLLQL